MPNPLVAVAGIGTGVTGAIGANQQKKAAQGATAAQMQAADKAIAEQRRQFDVAQKLFAPYVEGGATGLGGFIDMIGLGAPGAQEQAIQRIEQGPQFEALMRQGEEAILQNASATGGLRGGNVQGALARFRPQVLSDLIQQQMAGFTNLAQLGQASAAGQASGALQTGANVGNLLQGQGQAMAQGLLARGNASAAPFGAMSGLLGQFVGSKF